MTADRNRLSVRRLETSVGECITFLVAACGFFFMADDGPNGSDWADPVYVVFIAVALGWVALAVRAARAGVVASPQGVVVRNILRGHSIKWHDIADFDIGRRRFIGTPIPVVRLTSGRDVPMTSIEAPNPLLRSGNRDAPNAVEKLRAYHATIRSRESK